MLSKWIDLKDTAVHLRQNGQSIKTINRNLGIPLSTLSLWFKDIKLSDEQKQLLKERHNIALINARIKAAEWHRTQKALRLHKAKIEAQTTLNKIEITDEIIDLAFAMLYFGEGAKTDLTSLASSDPKILRFVISVLKRNYNIKVENLRCDLHLRMDQDPLSIKKYWSRILAIPIDRFKHVSFDKRTEGKATYDRYKGVCVISCGNIAIQRKLMYLYSLFCEKITEIEMGT